MPKDALACGPLGGSKALDTAIAFALQQISWWFQSPTDHRLSWLRADLERVRRHLRVRVKHPALLNGYDNMDPEGEAAAAAKPTKRRRQLHPAAEKPHSGGRYQAEDRRVYKHPTGL